MTASHYLFLTFLLICIISTFSENGCSITSDQCNQNVAALRYIFYDVNPYEGFNLRRDVYIRMAVLFNELKRDGINWKLILPPWDNLPHWKSVQAGSQSRLPWGLFFDLQSLQNYAPVIEMFEFLEDHPDITFDHLIILQHYRHIWEDDFTWTEKWDIEDCQRPTNFLKSVDGMFKGFYSGYEISAKEVLCISFQGSASLIKKVVEAFPGRFIAFQHAETIIHDFYGGPDYWKCRASMKFSEDLFSIATKFRFREFSLVSSIEQENNDSVFYSGHPYLCVHLRRRDYISSHPKQVPSLHFATVQIKRKLEQTELDAVFLATDALEEEKDAFLAEFLGYKVIYYSPSNDILLKFKDGGVAIIEQIICSQARYFIGTYESTFSFRIQEERELLGFHPDSTFNRLCGDDEVECKQPTRWHKAD